MNKIIALAGMLAFLWSSISGFGQEANPSLTRFKPAALADLVIRLDEIGEHGLAKQFVLDLASSAEKNASAERCLAHILTRQGSEEAANKRFRRAYEMGDKASFIPLCLHALKTKNRAFFLKHDVAFRQRVVTDPKFFPMAMSASFILDDPGHFHAVQKAPYFQTYAIPKEMERIFDQLNEKFGAPSDEE